MLPGVKLDGAMAVAERIRSAFAAATRHWVIWSYGRCSASAWSEREVESGGLDMLLHLADKALYAAKRNGRDHAWARGMPT
jgi:PleD family two-component response regulator